MLFYKPIVLPVVESLRSLVLDAKHRGGSTIILLPLAPGETERAAIEAREAWPPGTESLVQLPHPLPPGWDVIASPS